MRANAVDGQSNNKISMLTIVIVIVSSIGSSSSSSSSSSSGGSCIIIINIITARNEPNRRTRERGTNAVQDAE